MESHISVDSLKKAKENGIVMLTFPPHCSHKMQPLDVSVYFPLKNFYNTQCASWMVSNPGQTLSIYNIASLASRAFELAFTPKNIVAGFSSTGICPLNRDVFTEIDFMSSAVTDRPLEPTSTILEEEAPKSKTGAQEEILTVENNLEDKPSTSKFFVSPEILRPLPKAGPRKQIARRKRGSSRILTDTPEKDAIEAEANARKIKKKLFR